MSVSSLRQLYYNLIYPYISYGLASWGAACQTRLQTVRKKQNKCIRSIFFASQRENASIYYKLLELHNLDNVFNIKIASLVYKLKYLLSNTPAALHKLISPSSGVHNYNTRYSSKENLYRPMSRTNYDLHLWPLESGKKYLTVWNHCPFLLLFNSISATFLLTKCNFFLCHSSTVIFTSIIYIYCIFICIHVIRYVIQLKM